jgi:hypothetical protein
MLGIEVPEVGHLLLSRPGRMQQALADGCMNWPWLKA